MVAALHDFATRMAPVNCYGRAEAELVPPISSLMSATINGLRGRGGSGGNEHLGSGSSVGIDAAGVLAGRQQRL